MQFLPAVSTADNVALVKADASYGSSWKKRGGVGAFMMLARKWDRLSNYLEHAPAQYDIFSAIAGDTRPEGIIDDIRDLRRYLMLVESEMLARGQCPGAVAKDVAPVPAQGYEQQLAREDLLGGGAVDAAQPTATDLHTAPEPSACGVDEKLASLNLLFDSTYADALRSGKHIPSLWADLRDLALEIVERKTELGQETAYFTGLVIAFNRKFLDRKT